MRAVDLPEQDVAPGPVASARGEAAGRPGGGRGWAPSGGAVGGRLWLYLQVEPMDLAVRSGVGEKGKRGVMLLFFSF